MAINWFEGGRRISQLCIGIVIVGGMAIIFLDGGGARLTFETTTSLDGWHFTTKPCSPPDYAEYLDYSLPIDGKSEDVALCFRTQDGKLLYQSAPPIQLPAVGNPPKGSKPPVLNAFATTDPYSEEGRAYIVERSRRFEAPSAEMQGARSNFWKMKWKLKWTRFKEAIPWVSGLVFGIWLMTAVIGWIVRGFAGIPTGRDFRDGIS